MTTELTQEKIKRRQELTQKLKDKTINHNEANELRSILEIEREKAEKLNDSIGLVAITFLLDRVNKFLSSKIQFIIEGLTSEDFPKGIDLNNYKNYKVIIEKLK